MKTFFTIFVLLGVLGFAALNLSVVGTMVYVLGVVAAIIALLLAVQERQQRIEEKLDKLLAACVGEEAPAGEEAPPASGRPAPVQRDAGGQQCMR